MNLSGNSSSLALDSLKKLSPNSRNGQFLGEKVGNAKIGGHMDKGSLPWWILGFLKPCEKQMMRTRPTSKKIDRKSTL